MRDLEEPAPQKPVANIKQKGQLIPENCRLSIWAVAKLKDSTKKAFVRFCTKYSAWIIWYPTPGQFANPFRLVYEGVLEKAPYSHVGSSTVLIRLASWFFYLFQKVKSEWTVVNFQNMESGKAKAAMTLYKLREEYFQHCFPHWKIQMVRSRDH